MGRFFFIFSLVLLQNLCIFANEKCLISMNEKKPRYIDGVGWRYESEHSMLHRMQVRCHNNTTPANLKLIERQKSYFLERAKMVGVVVSPCISQGEKEIAHGMLEALLPLIVILENGFPPMYKPPGQYFEACTDGLLLMIAPWPIMQIRER